MQQLQPSFLWRALYLFWYENLCSSIVWVFFPAALRFFPKKVGSSYALFQGTIIIYREYLQPSILSTVLHIFLTLRFAAIQFYGRNFQPISEHQSPWNKFLIKAAVFSEQHRLYRNKNSHLKLLLFCRQKFLRILSCLEQILLSTDCSWLQILFLISYSLKINTFSGQLPFRRNLFSRISNYSEHVLFRSWCFFRRATFSLELF